MFAFLLSLDSDVGGQVPDHKPDRGRGDKGQKAGGQVRGAGEDVRGERSYCLHETVTASYNECVTVDL